MNERKEAITKKRWQMDLIAEPETTLRLTEPWHGTRHIVVGHSWFASVKNAVELKEEGFINDNCENSHWNLALKASIERCPQEKCGFISAT